MIQIVVLLSYLAGATVSAIVYFKHRTLMSECCLVACTLCVVGSITAVLSGCNSSPAIRPTQPVIVDPHQPSSVEHPYYSSPAIPLSFHPPVVPQDHRGN